MGTVVVAEESSILGAEFKRVLESLPDVVVKQAADLDEAETVTRIHQPHVLLLGPSCDATAALEMAQALLADLPQTSVVLVANEPDAILLRHALRSGVRDVVPADEPASAVAEAVQEAYAASEGRRATARIELPAPAEPQVDAAARGKVVTVFSTKGGVGKTVIASNLGVAMASKGVKTVLLDLDLQFGDTGIVLQMTPERTITDAVQAFERLDAEMFKGFLVHHKSGLDVLLAPTRPEDADMVSASRVSRLIRLAAEIADMVVIDTPAVFDEVVLTAIDESDEVYAVATMDVASIKNTKISLQKLRQLGYDDRLVRLVLNRADSKVWLDPGEVEQVVESEIIAKIPSDRLVPRSVNKGVPVVLDAPKSPVAKSLSDLAARIANTNGKEAGHVS